MHDLVDYLIEHGFRALMFWIIGMCSVFVLFGIFNFNPLGNFPSIDRDAWQAVFLENEQVYFGKLKEYDQQYVILDDVYYLRTVADLESEDSANLNLIKLGGEVHGPEDYMFIRKESILYFENMKETSRVVQSILKSKQ